MILKSNPTIMQSKLNLNEHNNIKSKLSEHNSSIERHYVDENGSPWNK